MELTSLQLIIGGNIILILIHIINVKIIEKRFGRKSLYLVAGFARIVWLVHSLVIIYTILWCMSLLFSYLHF